MDNLPRIRTPWKQQWRRVRYQLVPVVTLALSIVAVGWLWNQHVGIQMGLGEVDADSRMILCPTDGMLTATYAMKLYDPVAQDQPVAQLDATQANQSLKVLEAELKRMKAEIPAKIEALRDLHGTRQEERATEERRLASKVYDLKVSILEVQAKISRNNLELNRLDGEIESIKKSNGQGLAEVQHQRNMLAEKAKGEESLLAASRTQLADTLKRIEAYKTFEMGDVNKQIAPFEAAIEAQEKKIAELQQHIASLEIRSPFRGRVVAIHRHPGQLIRAGEPLMTIADEHGGHIKCYIRQDQRIAPEVGMRVEVRPRMPGSKAAESVIEIIGPQLEQVPHHLLHDPRSPEWGLPVHIVMPPQMNLRPGELVDLLFKQDKT